MIENPEGIIEDLKASFRRQKTEVMTKSLTHEPQRAPHIPHALPAGKCAVYVFSLSAAYGARCPAGAHRVLKVGKAGPNSNARFQSQHYNPKSSGSNLAKSLVRMWFLHPYLGIDELAYDDAGKWVRANLDRDNFYLDAEHDAILGILETYLKGITGPVFEGAEDALRTILGR